MIEDKNSANKPSAPCDIHHPYPYPTITQHPQFPSLHAQPQHHEPNSSLPFFFPLLACLISLLLQVVLSPLPLFLLLPMLSQLERSGPKWTIESSKHYASKPNSKVLQFAQNGAMMYFFQGLLKRQAVGSRKDYASMITFKLPQSSRSGPKHQNALNTVPNSNVFQCSHCLEWSHNA